ncbi:MAG: sugar ABC transporter substrate-binding protein, partial [Desulfobacteraceae bacterium]|nr:sugar ABC transporter substrate-binding protein [Desulfobacteraceae bacterium]
KQGALGGFVADDEKLGYYLAQTVVDVLINGKSTASVPVKFDEDPKFFVNLKTAEKLGVELPYAILQAATIIE